VLKGFHTTNFYFTFSNGSKTLGVQPCSFWPSRIAWWKPLWPALTPKPEVVILQACHWNVTAAPHDEIFDKNMCTASIIWSILGRAEMAPRLLSHSQVYSLCILYPVICFAFHSWNVKLNSHNHGNNTTQPFADALPPPPTASGDLEAQPYVQRCMVWLDGQKTGLDQLILINYLNLSHSLRGDFGFNSQVW